MSVHISFGTQQTAQLCQQWSQPGCPATFVLKNTGQQDKKPLKIQDIQDTKTLKKLDKQDIFYFYFGGCIYLGPFGLQPESRIFLDNG